MSFNGIVVGDFGGVAQLTILDIDTGLAADISGYATTIQMIFTNPSGTEIPKTATFVTDGTDGKIKYTIEDGLFNAAGIWSVRGRVQGASSKLTSLVHRFNVGA